MRELFNIPDCEYSGVYQIRNLRTSKIYIGSSSELKTRATVHKREIQKMRHSNKNINADAFNGDDFIFEILEIIKCDFPEENRAMRRFCEYREIKARLERGEVLYNSENIKVVISCTDKAKKN